MSDGVIIGTLRWLSHNLSSEGGNKSVGAGFDEVLPKVVSEGFTYSERA
jgi:hypothetical protein